MDARKGREAERRPKTICSEFAESTAAVPLICMVLKKDFESVMLDTLVISARGQQPSESTEEK